MSVRDWPRARPIPEPIRIINPVQSGTILNFTLNGFRISLVPGQSQELNDDRRWVIEFGRGGRFGLARYTLRPAGYYFASTAGGFELFGTVTARRRPGSAFADKRFAAASNRFSARARHSAHAAADNPSPLPAPGDQPPALPHNHYVRARRSAAAAAADRPSFARARRSAAAAADRSFFARTRHSAAASDRSFLTRARHSAAAASDRSFFTRARHSAAAAAARSFLARARHLAAASDKLRPDQIGFVSTATVGGFDAAGEMHCSVSV